MPIPDTLTLTRSPTYFLACLLTFIQTNQTNYLQNRLPSELVLLTALTQLSLGNNRFFGSIPPEFAQFHSLQELDLSQNLYVGTIPTELYSMTNLKRLVLNENLLTGAISPDMAQWTQMEYLYLNSNSLTSSIPDVFFLEGTTLGNLIELHLQDNQFTGNLPSSLANCTNLLYLATETNQLVGTMPDGICALTLDSLSHLSADCANGGKVECHCCSGCPTS
jgi:Leucine-rich repeat (LRR) protein